MEGGKLQHGLQKTLVQFYEILRTFHLKEAPIPTQSCVPNLQMVGRLGTLWKKLPCSTTTRTAPERVTWDNVERGGWRGRRRRDLQSDLRRLPPKLLQQRILTKKSNVAFFFPKGRLRYFFPRFFGKCVCVLVCAVSLQTRKNRDETRRIK